MKCSLYNRQRGIGLLELMLSLAIIAILLVMATRYFTSARQGQQVASAVSIVNAITAAASNYTSTQGGGSAPSSIGKIDSYLPQGGTTSPWGGAITVSGTATSFAILIPNVPSDACTLIGNALANTGATAAASGSNCSVTVNLIGQ